MACEYPFKSIIGVEFSPALHSVAELNYRKYKSPTQRCRNIELLRLDAAEFDLPDGPLVLFMYNPFDETIMRRMAENVAASLRRSPRPLTVVYFNPKVRAPVGRVGVAGKRAGRTADLARLHRPSRRRRANQELRGTGIIAGVRGRNDGEVKTEKSCRR